MGLETLRASGALLDTFERDGRTILRLKCNTCGKEFERDLHGTGMSARLQSVVYCSRACSQRGQVRRFRECGGDSQLLRFKNFKEARTL